MFDKLITIKQTIRGMGTRPAVIDAVDMLCDIIGEIYYAQVPVYNVQEEVSVPVETSTVCETELPVNENKGDLEADKATEVTEIETEIKKMSNEEVKDVISSAPEAAEAIKKEKKKKQDTLDKIFSDNKSGRYSGPIDA
jgi:hypothetical protein